MLLGGIESIQADTQGGSGRDYLMQVPVQPFLIQAQGRFLGFTVLAAVSEGKPFPIAVADTAAQFEVDSHGKGLLRGAVERLRQTDSIGSDPTGNVQIEGIIDNFRILLVSP